MPTQLTLHTVSRSYSHGPVLDRVNCSVRSY
jgi:hypothetical protein